MAKAKAFGEKHGAKMTFPEGLNGGGGVGQTPKRFFFGGGGMDIFCNLTIFAYTCTITLQNLLN